MLECWGCWIFFNPLFPLPYFANSSFLVTCNLNNPTLPTWPCQSDLANLTLPIWSCQSSFANLALPTRSENITVPHFLKPTAASHFRGNPFLKKKNQLEPLLGYQLVWNSRNYYKNCKTLTITQQQQEFKSRKWIQHLSLSRIDFSGKMNFLYHKKLSDSILDKSDLDGFLPRKAQLFRLW